MTYATQNKMSRYSFNKNKSKRIVSKDRSTFPFYKKISVVNPRDGAMPKQYSATLSYCDILEVTTTGAGPSVYTFRANSCFDPDYTGTGHQPRGFDQLMQFYNKFTVLGSFITVHASNEGAATGTVVGVGVSDDVAFVPTSAQWMELPRLRFVCGRTYGRDFSQVTNSFDSKEFFGITAPIQEDLIGGSVTANPINMAYYHVIVENAPIDATKTINLVVKINYRVVLHGPKWVGPS